MSTLKTDNITTRTTANLNIGKPVSTPIVISDDVHTDIIDSKNASEITFNKDIVMIDKQVLGVRKLGWGSPTGVATKTTFDTTTVTVNELAERVKALIDDLTAHGLIGA